MPSAHIRAAQYRQAADRGDVDAMFNLGVLLERGGEGLEKDLSAAVALYRQAVELGSVKAMCNLAVLLRRGETGLQKDVPAAAELYRRAVEHGNVNSMVTLAWLLQRGKEGVQRDVPAAVTLYRQAATRGNPVAMCNLAWLLEHGQVEVEKDMGQVVALYRQAAQRGNVNAMVNLACLLARGASGVEQDIPSAIALYRQAARLGNSIAMHNLAELLRRGEDGVIKDVPAAVALYRQAADLGNVRAINNLAGLFRHGEEAVERDMPVAMAFYQQAIGLGSTKAMCSLAAVLKRGENGVQKDVPAAMALYGQAAEHGSAVAMCNLAWLLERGEDGVERDVFEAVRLYRQAIKRGEPTAMVNLAGLLQRGEKGVNKDIQEAVELYRQAAELGNVRAMYYLAWLLQHGESGVEKNLPVAVSLLRRAAELGNANAMNHLALLMQHGEAGVDKDVSAAVALYKQAIELGNADAMSNLANLLEHGVGMRRDVASALDLLERAVLHSHDFRHKTKLAKLLLSEDVGPLRNPSRAAGLLEEVLKQNSTYGPALHELAVLYSSGDENVPPDRRRAAHLHSLAASMPSYENVAVFRADRIVIEAGEKYVEVVEEILRKGSAKPKTCLLLTLGGGGRGKTSTVNSLRGMPFVASHVPTEMAALGKFVIEPGIRGLAEDIIEECDFNENSLRANASRLHKEVVSKGELQSRSQSTSITGLLDRAQLDRSVSCLTGERPHADVIERVRTSLLQDKFPVGFNGSVVQVWDMAGQSQYEMAHSMVIERGSILLFFTDLERVEDEDTRESEVKLLCYWMQLAHILVPNPSVVRVMVVGTRRAKCGEDTLGILKDCMAKQLASKVYNSWIRTRPAEEGSGNIPKFIAIENSKALEYPQDSGLEELEGAVKAAGDEIVASRDAVPLRWLAFVDKLEREHKSSAQIYFSRENVRYLSVGFPGFALDNEEREKDVLEGLRCLASMGRLVLFEYSDEEWYVFMDVGKIIGLLGKVTSPEERLQNGLSVEDRRSLKLGKISQSALFSLWERYEEEGKKLMLRLLCRFDLLMLLEGDEASIEKGEVTVGVPALLPYGWDGLTWGRGTGEKDLEVTTRFAEAIPNGLVGILIAHIHRTLVLKSAASNATRGASPKVRADAALLKVRDGSRIFVGIKGPERQICWKFRGQRPVQLARESIHQVEDLLSHPSRFMSVDHRHVVVLECSSSRGGCGASGTIEIELSRRWIVVGDGSLLPTEDVSCEACWRPWSSAEISGLLWPKDCSSATDLEGMEPVMTPRKYEVFVSHAGPDKLTLAEPIYKGLAWHNVHSFLDMEDLQINEGTAAEIMERAMREARVGIFVMSPEFAAREWTMKELRHFLERDERSREEETSRPVLLPLFFRLSLEDCKRSDARIYGEDSKHQEVLRRNGFFKSERQAKCSTQEAVESLKMLTKYSGLEVSRIGGGEDLSSAAVVSETVRRVVDFLGSRSLI